MNRDASEKIKQKKCDAPTHSTRVLLSLLESRVLVLGFRSPLTPLLKSVRGAGGKNVDAELSEQERSGAGGLEGGNGRRMGRRGADGAEELSEDPADGTELVELAVEIAVQPLPCQPRESSANRCADNTQTRCERGQGRAGSCLLD
jgi:hypothetical protein